MSDSFFIEFRYQNDNYIVEVMEKNGKPFYSTFKENYGRISKPVESDRIVVGNEYRNYNVKLEINLEEYSEYKKVKAHYTNHKGEKVDIKFVEYSKYNPLGHNYKHQYLIKDFLLRLLKSADLEVNSYDLNIRKDYKYQDDEIIETQSQLYEAERLYYESYLPSSKVDVLREHSQEYFPNIYCKIDLEDISHYFEEDEMDLSSTFTQKLTNAKTYLKIAKLTPIRDFEIPTTDFYKLQGIVSSHSLRKYKIGYIRSSYWTTNESVVFNFNLRELDYLIDLIEEEESKSTNFNSCQPLQWCIERMEGKSFYGDLNHDMSKEIEGWLEDNSFDHYGFDYIHKKMEVYHEKDDYRKMFVFPDAYVTIDYNYEGNINYLRKVSRKSFFDLDLPNFNED